MHDCGNYKIIMKILKKLQNKKFLSFVPIICIVFIWIAFSFPYFFEKKVPFPASYQVNHFHPWRMYEEYAGPVKNGAMPDIIDQIYPWRHFSIESLKNKEIPLWNPNNFSGSPHLANFQSAVLSPFNVLFFVLPFLDAWSILILLQPLLAALFTYMYLREINSSKLASFLGAITFSFCGFMVVWMAYGLLSMAILFLPLSLYAIEKYYKSNSYKYLFLLALTIPFSFFAGHFQTSLYFFIYVLLYCFFKFITLKKSKATVLLCIAISFGFGISLLQIIPSIQFYFNSVRSEIYISGGGIPLYYLVTVFAPDFFGNPVTLNDWFGSYAEFASFIGIIPLTLALYSLFSKRRSYAIFYLLCTFSFLLLAINSEVLHVLSSLKIPVLSTSTPSRIIVLVSFSLSILAVIGFDTLKELILKKRKLHLFIPIGIVSIIVISVWISVVLFQILPLDRATIAKRNLILPSAIFGLFIVGLMVTTLKQKLIPLFLIGIVILATFDSFRFAQKWMPFDSRNLVFIDLPVVTAIEKNLYNGRVFGNIGAQVNSYYNLPGIEGYDPLYIKRYGELIRSSVTGSFQNAERSVVKVDRNGKYTDRIIDLLGVKVIYHPISDTNTPWGYNIWDNPERFSIIYEDNRVQLLRNNTALNRATLYYSYVVESKDKEIINILFSEDFDIKKTVILENKPKLPIKESTKSGTVNFVKDSPLHIVLQVETPQNAILFLSDNYYPGWEAFVNGNKVPIIRADYTFRAVEVPAGVSRVEFKYSPNWIL